MKTPAIFSQIKQNIEDSESEKAEKEKMIFLEHGWEVLYKVSRGIPLQMAILTTRRENQ